jgi:hypothetical protein
MKNLAKPACGQDKKPTGQGLRASEASQRTQTPKTETAGNVSCGQDQRPTDQDFKVREKSSDRLPNGRF